MAIQPALEGEYRQRHIDVNRFTFGDMIDPRYGFNYPVMSAGIPSSGKTFFDMGTGLLVYTKSVYAGFSLAHLLTPEISFIRPHAGSTLPLKYSYNAGAIFHSGDSDLWSFFLVFFFF